MQVQKTAPKDAAKHRKAVYLMLDQMIQPTKRADGLCTTEIYLDDHRLSNKAKIIGGVTDTNFLAELETASGFYNCIDAIGISVTSKEEESVLVQWKNYGKEDRYHGTQMELLASANGVEHYLEFQSCSTLEQDAVVGQLVFHFQQEQSTASVTVKLYIKESRNDLVIPDIQPEEEVDFTSEKVRQLIQKSLLKQGNLYRIQKMIEKAKRGEKVTIACIGGSITQGAGAVPIHTHCYAYRFYEKLCELLFISKENCTFIKAGIGGTSSELGLIRYESQVEGLGEKPDLVLVEFAVNDLGDETEGICHESLIYKILSEEQNPAVIMLFSVFADDWNLQERLIPIGNAYDLPMVSLKDALVDQFGQSKENGQILSKRQYFYDIFHPTNVGHEFMANCALQVIQCALESAKEEKDIDLSVPEAIGRKFHEVVYFDRENMEQGTMDLRLTSAKIQVKAGDFIQKDSQLQSVERNQDVKQTPQFIHNWMHKEHKTKESFRMTITCKALFLLIKDSDDPSFGKADIFVDGKKARTYDAREVGWTHANAALILDETTAMEHLVEVKMAAFCEDKKFTILGIGVVV